MWFLNRKKERERINNVLGLWCLGDWCLVFDGLFFFLGVDGRLWVAGGGGGVRCV